MRTEYLLTALFTASTLLTAAVPARISQPIDASRPYVLTGHTHPALQSAHDLGEANASLQMPSLTLHFKMTAAQKADLSNLLSAQRDRHSASYHKWLTPEQFGARFGLNEEDLAKVKQWLEREGFNNVETSLSRTFIHMSGTAADVNRVFAASVHSYQQGAQQYYANATDPSFPRALQGIVGGLRGLTNYRAHSFIRTKAISHISVGINGNHFLAPDDLATIYNLRPLYSQGIDGSGQSIAVVGQSDIAVSDIEAFQKAVGLPIKDPQIVTVGIDPGLNVDDESEADLDLEWAGAVARGAEVIYVNSADALDSATYAIEQNVAPVVSISYGLCEAGMDTADMQTYNDIFEQAGAQGITVVVSSGDTGAAACDDNPGAPESAAVYGPAVNFPASSPYVTAVGGTEFDESQGSFWDSNGHALSYIPEIAWNDTASEKVLSGSGGGASTEFQKPSWQSGLGVPADGFRDVPDIALSASPAHDAYLICTHGSCSDGFAPPVDRIYFVGGTSCSAPVFAGMLALLNQNTSGRQGNVNAELYSLASFTSGVFHDVELGDNIVPCVAGSTGCVNGTLGFTAGQGYDQVTGLGSVDGTQMVEQWAADFDISSNPASLSMDSGTSGTANLMITRFANFSGAVSFACSVSSSLTNTSCSVPGTLTGSGTIQLKVSNTKSSAAFPRMQRFRKIPPTAGLLLVGALAVVVALRPRRRWAYSGVAALTLSFACACGPGVPATTSVNLTSTPLTGKVTVTAMCGSLQHSVAIPVTIAQ